MKLAIYGYGNIGRGVELAARAAGDIELVGVFTRRDPSTVHTLTGAPVFSAEDVQAHAADIDVMLICGGSATDLPVLTPKLAATFNVVDSFDTHARIPEHFAAVDAAAQAAGTTALISGGWDPGLFSLARLYATAALPNGSDYTFWGRGVSQGHSDAIRRIPGVLDARQYTVPVASALEAVRAGDAPALTTRDKHTRECYVVAAPDADRAAIENAIKTMPNYFADYDTTVTFISAEEMARDHAELPHGGSVIRTGATGLGCYLAAQEAQAAQAAQDAAVAPATQDAPAALAAQDAPAASAVANAEASAPVHKHCVEFKLTLDSNPEFTAGVLVACARAIARMNARGQVGCKTMFDIAPADLSALSPEELRAHML